jgi:hypothetical protein
MVTTPSPLCTWGTFLPNNLSNTIRACNEQMARKISLCPGNARNTQVFGQWLEKEWLLDICNNPHVNHLFCCDHANAHCSTSLVQGMHLGTHSMVICVWIGVSAGMP